MARRSAPVAVLYQRTALALPDAGALEHALGYRFTNAQRLTQALTHASYGPHNYERLEFLGDRVLGLVLAEWLSELKPGAGEGELAKALAALAARDSVADVARRAGIAPHVRVSNKDVALQARDNATILGDVCEAIIAALYLDGGLEPARAFIRRYWQSLLEAAPETGDSKTRLQEWSQGRGLGLPDYRVIERSGPDHAPEFVVEVAINNVEPVRARGASKRIAEREAASALLTALGEMS